MTVKYVRNTVFVTCVRVHVLPRGLLVRSFSPPPPIPTSYRTSGLGTTNLKKKKRPDNFTILMRGALDEGAVTPYSKYFRSVHTLQLIPCNFLLHTTLGTHAKINCFPLFYFPFKFVNKFSDPE